jgi:hypothetical protein
MSQKQVEQRAMAALQMVEDAIAKSSEGHRVKREKAEQAYEDRVLEIGREQHCSASEAYARSFRDEKAMNLYEQMEAAREAEIRSVTGGSRIGAVVD